MQTIIELLNWIGDEWGWQAIVAIWHFCFFLWSICCFLMVEWIFNHWAGIKAIAEYVLYSILLRLMPKPRRKKRK